MFSFLKPKMPTATDALPGRDQPILEPKRHTILGTPIAGPYPDGFQVAEFALGCFWGDEKTFWAQPGVWTTAVGYQGGYTPNATYKEVCTGQTGHAESVRVVFDPSKTSYEQLLKVFWENHDPTQGMRQGNDMGTQYRSAIFVHDDAQRAAAEASKSMYQAQLSKARYGEITTEIVGPPAPTFFFAEDYHQQYLDKVPNGYCPNHSTGVRMPTDFAIPATPLQYVE
jgi:peptide-methionine (S)-S-oxide reductase